MPDPNPNTLNPLYRTFLDALRENPKLYPDFLQVRALSSKAHAIIAKSEVIVVFPSNERLSWDDADLRIQEYVSRLQISGPLYCQGREIKGGLHHAN